MAKVRQLVDYISQVESVAKKAYGVALIETAQDAEKFAKLNAKKQFKGRYGYTLSGRLLNSIFHDYKMAPDGPTAFVGTRGIPYGRIHEEGGTIKAGTKNAKYLWQRLAHKGSPFRRMTPSEFFNNAKKSGKYIYLKTKSQGKGKRWVAGHMEKGKAKTGKAFVGSFTPIFLLRDYVTIKKRPYLYPAAVRAGKLFPNKMNRRMNELIGMGY